MNTSDPGIICPACKMKNESGAILCTYCNTPLGNNPQKTLLLRKTEGITGTLPDILDDVLDAPSYRPERYMDFEIPAKGIILIHLETGQPLTIQQKKAFILGRASDGIKTREPLVDLTDYHAMDYGISRIHALIRRASDGYELIDLDSTNGTWIENQRLVPQEPALIQSGDRIRLGRLHMLVFYMS